MSVATRTPVQVTEGQLTVLKALKGSPALSRKEINERAGVNITNVTRVLRGLAERELIHYTHDDPGVRFHASLTRSGAGVLRRSADPR